MNNIINQIEPSQPEIKFTKRNKKAELSFVLYEKKPLKQHNENTIERKIEMVMDGTFDDFTLISQAISNSEIQSIKTLLRTMVKYIEEYEREEE